MKIILKVNLHPSGNRTLMEKKEEHGWADVKEPEGVLANSNEARFYRATANYIAGLSQDGHQVQFQDARDD